ncbi:hypothetical protein B0H17DRAFT_1215640 [Mycena rosella]|uniref:F-box domain-containing protein n=1 Tax=Mycena rosella TaxID=1033263 RepID=A0AAD7CGU2_MYCRO|nr:hypothetical protein B0H17DRAFT_1215640 [Mycena rosella]
MTSIAESHIAPPSSRRVPVETWTQIFEELPRDSLSQARLVDALFQRITRPLLFREFNFHPYARRRVERYALPTWDLCLPQPAHVELLLQRLQFWLSDEIAPFVRICSITPCDSTHWQNLRSDWEFSRKDDPYILLATLFDSLPRFTNVRRLVATLVPFTDIAVQNLGLLPNLTHLEVDTVDMSKVTLDVVNLSRSRLAVSSFMFRYEGREVHNFRKQDGTAMEKWLPTLRPDTLHHLDLPYQQPAFTRIQFGAQFPRVNTLKFEWKHPTALNLDVLSKFPATEVLIIQVDEWREMEELQNYHHDIARTSPFQVLTSLKEYTGPLGLIPCFSPIPTLNRLTLSHCNPRDLLDLHGHVPTLINITSLSADFTQFSMANLQDLCRFFPSLTELRVVVDLTCVTFEAEEFFRTLCESSPLPATIKKSVIYWPSNKSNREHYDQLALESVVQSILSNHPTMEFIWLDMHGSMLLWRRGYAEAYQYYDSATDRPNVHVDHRREGRADLWALPQSALIMDAGFLHANERVPITSLIASGLLQTPMSESTQAIEPDTVSASGRIPVETWCQIFEELPRDSLAQAYLVDSLFQRIARPLLFREFNFHPYARRTVEHHHFTTWDLCLPQPAHVELLLQRKKLRRPPTSVPLHHGALPSMCLTAGNYRLRLVATLVPFTDIAVQNLGLLPNLTHLEVDKVDLSRVTEGVVNLSRSRLAVSSFMFRYERNEVAKSRERDETAMERWLPMFFSPKSNPALDFHT